MGINSFSKVQMTQHWNPGLGPQGYQMAKRNAKMSQPLYHQIKNAEVAILPPSKCLLKLLTWMHSWARFNQPSGVAVMNSLPSCPHNTGLNSVTKPDSQKKKSPGAETENSATLPFSESYPTLSPAYKSSRYRELSFPLCCLPPFCSSIGLIKPVWKLLWGVLSVSTLGTPGTPMPVTIRQTCREED